jgi:hypothetical protein
MAGGQALEIELLRGNVVARAWRPARGRAPGMIGNQVVSIERTCPV